MSNQMAVSGHIFIFHAFDVGDEIDLTSVVVKRCIKTVPRPLAKYFKNYHAPLSIELPSQDPLCDSAKLHNFGVITLRYRIPFTSSFEGLRTTVLKVEDQYEKQSEEDALLIFDRINQDIKQPRFFNVRNSYMLIQIATPAPSKVSDLIAMNQGYGDAIATLLRFETETLSEHQKNEVLTGAFSYYQKDLVIIDIHASLICDDEYEETLDLFEFANMQYLELQYFDRVLDKQLHLAYEQEKKSPGITAYLPFIGVIVNDPVSELNKLKVDISVITDRLETSIKLAGEAYFSKLYHLLSDKLDLDNWKASISRKLEIIQEIGSMHQHKLEVIREDLLTCSIIILIMLELGLGVFNLWRH